MKDDCIFCQIIRKELPGKEVFRDDDVVAFHDITPKAPVHVLVVPVKHMASLQDAETNDEAILGKMMGVTRTVAKQLGIAKGFKVIINNGPSSGQVVFHLHAHVLGGWKKKQIWDV